MAAFPNPQRELTLQDFEALANLPENRNRHLEWIAGRMVEVVSNSYTADVTGRLHALLGAFIIDHDSGRIFSAESGFLIGNERYMPDIAFVSYERQPEDCHETWNPHVPELVVEVISPTDDSDDVRVKVTNYLRAGAVVWVVLPLKQHVEVHAPGEWVRVLPAGDVLKGTGLLNGFELPLTKLFRV